MSRLQAVPFWIIERTRKKLERTSSISPRYSLAEREKKWSEPLFISACSSLAALWAHPLDYPERDCLKCTTYPEMTGYVQASRPSVNISYIAWQKNKTKKKQLWFRQAGRLHMHHSFIIFKFIPLIRIIPFYYLSWFSRRWLQKLSTFWDFQYAKGIC